MSKAGRDERGRFVDDDETVKQIVTPILGALTLLMDQVQDKDVKVAVATHIIDATLAAGVLNVGRRPKKETDDERLAAT